MHPAAGLAPALYSASSFKAAYGGAGFAMPLCFKWAVEAVARGPVAAPPWRQPVLRALLAAGVCRAVSGIARDLQAPVFQLISQVGRRGRCREEASPCFMPYRQHLQCHWLCCTISVSSSRLPIERL